MTKSVEFAILHHNLSTWKKSCCAAAIPKLAHFPSYICRNIISANLDFPKSLCCNYIGLLPLNHSETEETRWLWDGLSLNSFTLTVSSSWPITHECRHPLVASPLDWDCEIPIVKENGVRVTPRNLSFHPGTAWRLLIPSTSFRE